MQLACISIHGRFFRSLGFGGLLFEEDMNTLCVCSGDLWIGRQIKLALCVALVHEVTNAKDSRTGNEVHQEGTNDSNAGDSRI